MDRRKLPLVAVMVALVLGGGGCQDDAGPAPGADPVPSTTPPTSATPAPAPGQQPSPARPVLDAAALPTGEPPDAPYAVSRNPAFGGGDWQLVRPDGSRQPFGHNPVLFVAYDDRVVNGYGAEGGFVVEVLDLAGKPLLDVPPLCQFALVTTPVRDQAAWLEEGSLVSVHSDGRVDTRPVAMPGGACGAARPVALQGSTLYVDGPRVRPSLVDGADAPVQVPLLRDLEDVTTRGTVIGTLDEKPSCSGLVSFRSVLEWRTCEDQLVSFAPGPYVLGLRGDIDHTPFQGLVVHDRRDGQVRLELDNAPRQRVNQVAWEDSEHLLLVVRSPVVGWSVVRVGVDDPPEYAVAPVHTATGFPPFRLQLS